MIASFLITLREGIEAALILAIILSYLKKVNANQLLKPVYYGVGAGVLGSIGVGSLFLVLSFEFVGRAEQIFEGSTMFLAAAILTTMILWMGRNSKSYSDDLKRKVQAALSGKETLGLVILAFVSILREGIETVLFLGSASFTDKGAQTIVGGTFGLLLALLIGLAIIRYSVRLDLRSFFNVTGFFLILFAAGLVALGLGEFQEAGIVPPVIAHVWDTNSIVNDQSEFGKILTALFGYSGSPSVVQVIGYVGYWLIVVLWIYRETTFSLLRRFYASAVRSA